MVNLEMNVFLYIVSHSGSYGIRIQKSENMNRAASQLKYSHNIDITLLFFGGFFI